jgi:hypothetical protein
MGELGKPRVAQLGRVGARLQMVAETVVIVTEKPQSNMSHHHKSCQTLETNRHLRKLPTRCCFGTLRWPRCFDGAAAAPSPFKRASLAKAPSLSLAERFLAVARGGDALASVSMGLIPGFWESKSVLHFSTMNEWFLAASVSYFENLIKDIYEIQ